MGNGLSESQRTELYDVVRRYCHAQAGRLAAVGLDWEDAAQDAYLSACTTLHTFDPRRRIDRWAGCVAARTVLHALRARRAAELNGWDGAAEDVERVELGPAKDLARTARHWMHAARRMPSAPGQRKLRYSPAAQIVTALLAVRFGMTAAKMSATIRRDDDLAHALGYWHRRPSTREIGRWMARPHAQRLGDAIRCAMGQSAVPRDADYPQTKGRSPSQYTGGEIL